MLSERKRPSQFTANPSDARKPLYNHGFHADLKGDRPQPSLKDRLNNIRERIARAAARSDRPSDAIRLIAAVKTISAARINEAVAAGLREIGENKVQEAEAKRDAIGPAPGLVRHFIGGLQTNKARRAVALFDLIQSVDRPRLAEAIDRAAEEAKKRQPCLIEVKVSGEPTKSGVPLDAAADFIAEFHRYGNLELRGLMTIAPFDVPEHETRRCFRRMRSLFEAHRARLGPAPVLSMGMTDDFEMAIEEGATMVRIGRALFGERDYGAA